MSTLPPITLKGVKQNNLKNIDVEIPQRKLTVITGLSGSGKSTLAFETLYAEGQRRYVESLSAYARQFLELMYSSRNCTRTAQYRDEYEKYGCDPN
jgi:excinuclease ABC subunit A